MYSPSAFWHYEVYPTDGVDTVLIPDSNTEVLFAAMADATRCLGGDLFSAALIKMIRTQVPVDSMAAVGFPEQARPLFLSEETRQDVFTKEGDLANYVGGAYLLDPFYRATLEQAPSGFYRLKDIAPDNFYDSEYFRQYYQFSNLTDEVGYLLAREGGAYLHLSLARIEPYTSDELKLLEWMTPWLLVMVERQWQNSLSRPELSSLEVTMHGQLSKAFENFGRSVLTDRECEVAHLILHGHSTKSMASKLDISVETIKVHRRNLYSKLDISSQPELFSLFLSSLSLVEAMSESDPLVAYHSIGRGPQ